jgi:hypothetical protein
MNRGPLPFSVWNRAKLRNGLRSATPPHASSGATVMYGTRSWSKKRRLFVPANTSAAYPRPDLAAPSAVDVE